MNPRSALFERLAEALADGSSVDWQAVEARCAGGPQAAWVANLRLLERLADGVQSRRHLARAQTDALSLWLRALRLLALLQAASAVLGFVLGARDGYRIPAALPVLVVLVCGAAAVVLLRFGRQDARATHLGLFFLLLAAACSHRASGFLAAAAPGWASVHAALHALAPECFLPYLLWSFVRGFPRLVLLRPLDAGVTLARRVSLVCGLGLFAIHAVAFALAPDAPERVMPIGMLTRWQEGGPFWGCVLLLSLPAPFVALRRARDAAPGERRRVALFAMGLLAGLAPLCLLVTLEAFVPAFARAMDAPANERLGMLAVFGGVLSLPLSSAYAVAAHRVLDVRVATLTLARRALTGAAGWVLPGAVAVAGARLLYERRDDSLATLASGAQAPLFAAWLVALFALWRWREAPRRALRRLLGPERPDWRQVVTRFGQDLRDMHGASEVHAALAATALHAVQVERAHLLARGEASFEPVAGALRALPLDSALAAALRVPSGEPLVADPDEPGSVFRWLPEAERAWLADGDVRLVLPVTTTGDDVSALLALGPRRDGRALDHDDRLVLTALASAAALALGRVAASPAHATGAVDLEALECTACPRVLSAGATCTCGASLRPARLPFVLAGKFQLESVLGRGGMGVVYRARDLSLDRRVALKTLPRVNAEAAVRLRAEARTMATLAHPHLASIHGAESWRGLPVLVVEHLDGGTLAERARSPLALDTVLALGEGLAAALEAMHHKGLLHRDVKPSNVGFAADGTPKLLDFGLARLMEEALGFEEPASDQARRRPLGASFDTLTATALRTRTAPESARTSWAGTVLYMPPEALAGAAAGVAQDLWGLALCLYEALAGRHPLAHSTPEDLEADLRAARFPPLRGLRPDCPPALEAFFDRALASSARARWPDATAFRDALSATTRAASA